MPTSETVPAIAFAPWDVVVVPFPYADRLAEKRRPVLVVSNGRLLEYGLLWVAMITSASNPPWGCDVAIGDGVLAGLAAPSVVRPAKLACIEPSRVLRRIGRLQPSAAHAVAERLGRFLGAE
ncbi:MAG TPA: type II toxin-antitoxin system PemK/MazF family toxin [Xanthobacteraceae bacterium]|nr:type II toxin-antitoxin system PemK/MazF family toxin [Xanthobacteraceae bacterium]